PPRARDAVPQHHRAGADHGLRGRLLADLGAVRLHRPADPAHAPRARRAERARTRAPRAGRGAAGAGQLADLARPRHRLAPGCAKGPICFVDALGGTLTVLEVRLAWRLRASPRSWTLGAAWPRCVAAPSIRRLAHEIQERGGDLVGDVGALAA